MEPVSMIGVFIRIDLLTGIGVLTDSLIALNCNTLPEPDCNGIDRWEIEESAIIEPVDSGNGDEAGSTNKSAIISGMGGSPEDVIGTEAFAVAGLDSDSVKGDNLEKMDESDKLISISGAIDFSENTIGDRSVTTAASNSDPVNDDNDEKPERTDKLDKSVLISERIDLSEDIIGAGLIALTESLSDSVNDDTVELVNESGELIDVSEIIDSVEDIDSVEAMDGAGIIIDDCSLAMDRLDRDLIGTSGKGKLVIAVGAGRDNTPGGKPGEAAITASAGSQDREDGENNELFPSPGTNLTGVVVANNGGVF